MKQGLTVAMRSENFYQNLTVNFSKLPIETTATP